jgi:hypothetical protein
MPNPARLQNPVAAALRLLGLVVVALAVSLVASPLGGGVVFALGLVVLVVYEVTRPAGMLRAAEDAPHPRGGPRHVLVVADAALAGEEVAQAIVEAAGPQAQLNVLAPLLVSRTHYVTSDHDAEAHEAEARLNSSLQWAAGHGFRARGQVGADEPVAAMADQLRDFGAQAAVIVTRRGHRPGWAEARQLKRARAELDITFTHVEV